MARVTVHPVALRAVRRRVVRQPSAGQTRMARADSRTVPAPSRASAEATAASAGRPIPPHNDTTDLAGPHGRAVAALHLRTGASDPRNGPRSRPLIGAMLVPHATIDRSVPIHLALDSGHTGIGRPGRSLPGPIQGDRSMRHRHTLATIARHRAVRRTAPARRIARAPAPVHRRIGVRAHHSGRARRRRIPSRSARCRAGPACHRRTRSGPTKSWSPAVDLSRRPSSPDAALGASSSCRNDARRWNGSCCTRPACVSPSSRWRAGR